jgi:hypothetical protein
MRNSAGAFGKDSAQTTLFWAAGLAADVKTTLTKASYHFIVAFTYRHQAAGDETTPQ